MSWDCARIEEHLSDYLEGRLPSDEAAAIEAHARSCARCAEWADARRATLWLREMEALESPPGLETRILALTVGPPAEETLGALLERGWRAMLQPRFAFGLVVALISLSLLFNAAGISVKEFSVADLNPVNIYRNVDRHAHLLYARGVRFVNDLRLVYEIRSRLEELQAGQEPPAPAPAPVVPDPNTPKEDKKPESSVERGRARWLLASVNFALLGELR